MNQQLAQFVAAHRNLLVLTGAGLSTASGIGDYRGTDGAWKRSPPVDLRDFLRSDHARRRYWSRSMVGWPRFAAAQPNAGHAALARLERAGRLAGTITQNVDSLHASAGHRGVVELHGRLADVHCLSCATSFRRDEIQRWLLAANPAFAARAVRWLADGDAELDNDDLDAFRVVNCPACDGLLKPSVVFFGESVPGAVVAQALALLERASTLLLVGTSVMVYSGYRFCRAAHAQGKPIVSINRGVTRADPLLAFKVEDDCGAALTALMRALDLCFDR